MPPNRFESEVESFLEGSHGDRTHHKQRADHHTVTPLCGTLLAYDQKPQYGKHRKEQHKWFAGLALRPYDEGYYHQQNQQQE